MRQKNLDLILTMIIAALNVIWVLLPIHTLAIGIILALPLVFVLPGYALSEALFQKQSLDPSRRILLSLGLSLTIDIVSGFILNMLIVGLQAASWAVLLGLLTAMFSLLAVYLRLRRGAVLNEAQLLKLHPSIYGCILFALAIIVTVLSVLYSVIGAGQQRSSGFTQLWMLPVTRDGEACSVRLGMRSFEATSETYRIAMTINSAPATSWPSVVLAPQEEWDRLVHILPTADKVLVEARLYRVDKPQIIYRRVNLTLLSCLVSKSAPTPSSGLSNAYSGTIHDLSVNLTTTISLTGVQQKVKIINGFFQAQEKTEL